VYVSLQMTAVDLVDVSQFVASSGIATEVHVTTQVNT